MAPPLRDARFSVNPILFGVSFDDCVLDYSWFTGLKMPATKFGASSLKGVNFSGSNAADCSFSGCDIDGSVFDQTRLDGTDFRGARNISIDPERNSLKKARFSPDGLEGLLQKYDLRIV